MFIFYKKILGLALAAGLAFAFFMRYDLLTEIPGFYCEGYGCLGTGLIYLIIAIAIIPLAIATYAFFSTTESKWSRALCSFGIACIVMLVSLLITLAWKDLATASAIRDSEIMYQESLDEMKIDKQVQDSLEKEALGTQRQSREEAARLAQTAGVNLRLGGGLLTSGIVTESSMLEINEGGHVKLQLDINGNDAYTIFNPVAQSALPGCLGKVDFSIAVGDKVEVRGRSIIGSLPEQTLFIDICSTSEGYLKKL